MSEKKRNEAKQEIIKKLESANPILIKETLIELREQGDSDYIPLLFELLLKHNDTNIADTLKSFISDIKDSSIKNNLVDCLNNENFNKIKKDLLTICWESRFDFSENLSIFVDSLINDDFMTAFEALTVIENLSGNISDEEKSNQINKLKEAISTTDETKKQFIHDAINIIPNIKASEE